MNCQFLHKTLQIDYKWKYYAVGRKLHRRVPGQRSDDFVLPLKSRVVQIPTQFIRERDRHRISESAFNLNPSKTKKIALKNKQRIQIRINKCLV